MKTYSMYISGILFIALLLTISCDSNEDQVNVHSQISISEICDMHNSIIIDAQQSYLMNEGDNFAIEEYLNEFLPKIYES